MERLREERNEADVEQILPHLRVFTISVMSKDQQLDWLQEWAVRKHSHLHFRSYDSFNAIEILLDAFRCMIYL